jgi:hypothetical protein
MNRLPLLSIALLFGLGNTASADEKPIKSNLGKRGQEPKESNGS